MRSIPHEGRHQYLVVEQFLANGFATGAFTESDEDYDEDQTLIRANEVLFADPAAWKGQMWKGQEIVRFFLGQATFYTSQQVFAESTRPINPSSKKEIGTH